MLLVVLLEVVLQASKTHPSPHRNTMLLKDGTTSKNMCPGAWRPFWILVKTKRVQLLGLLGLLGLLLLLLLLHAAGGTAGGGAASLQNAPFATPKHHATEGQNDLQKHAAPGLDVPSGFWKKKRLQLLGLLLLLVLLLEVVLQASKTHPSPHQNTMLLKDETTSKSIARTSSLEAGTSLLKSYLLSYPAIVLESSLILLSY